MPKDLKSLIEQHKHLSEEAQKSAGQAIAGAMDEEHTNFLKTVTSLIDSGAIDTAVPETFLKKENYDPLPDDAKRKVDLAMINIADLLRKIAEFYTSKETPDASPHLQGMIEHLWQMKQRVEIPYGDVFK